MSTTDPEAGLFHKGEKERCFAYSQHVVCDGNNLVIAVDTQPGNLHDSVTFFSAFKQIPAEIMKQCHGMALDAGYKTPAVSKYLFDHQIVPFLPYKRPLTKDGYFKKYEYAYDENRDEYICPNGNRLKYTTTNRKGYKEYKSSPAECAACPLREQCTQSKNKTKVYSAHVWEENLQLSEMMRLSLDFKTYYPKRKETIERVFAENKEHHNLRYTRLRGLEKNREQAKLIFACHNLKKLALWSWK